MTTPKHFMDNRPVLTNDEVQQEYSKQRKCRMQDAIDDYLNDDRVSSKQAYEEMLSCVQDVIDYHRTHADRANDLKHLMMGYREIEPYDQIPSRY